MEDQDAIGASEGTASQGLGLLISQGALRSHTAVGSGLIPRATSSRFLSAIDAAKDDAGDPDHRCGCAPADHAGCLIATKSWV
jgi:hypothetical protein